MKILSLTSLFTILLSISISLAQAQETSTITDVDGNVYETVKIGNQIWMAENLKTTRYRDGSVIPNVTDGDSWIILTTGAWVNYDNDTLNDDVYGKLYNWYTVNDLRGVCPVDWQVPENKDWFELINYLGGFAVAGGKLKAEGLQYWAPPNAGATNESKFSALPGAGFHTEAFLDLTTRAIFWSSTNIDNAVYSWALANDDFDVDSASVGIVLTDGYSIRCIKNAQNPPVENTLIDIDGNIYRTVVIGDQEWMAENLRVSRYRDGTEIPHVTEDLSWSGLSTGAWAIYGNTTPNDSIYGKLYNGFVVLNPRGICPTGWHIPTDAEWTILSNYLGGESVAGGKMKATGTQYWQSPNKGATNESGFTGLPAGSRPISESFSGLGYEAGFWSSTKYGNQNRFWTRYLGHDKTFLGKVDIGYNHGFSMRCIKDSQNPPPPPTDDTAAFSATLTISNAASNSLDLIFGQRSDATAGYDASLDQLAPPRPPTGTFDARFIRGSEEYYTDMQLSADSLASWRLMFSAGTGGYPITVRWDSTQLHDLSTDFYLRDAIDGSYINVRMTVADSVVISQSFITELLIVRVPFNVETQITQSYSQGWNLVGLPVDMAHSSYMDLYPTAYSNSLFGFSQAYELRQQLITGQGYWVRLTQAADVTYTGTSISSITRTLLSGWNLVSGPSTVMSVSSIGDPSGILSTSPVYGFSGSYTQATSLEPGRGYWIRANTGGDIVLGATSKTLANSKSLSSTQEYSQLHRLEVFTQSAGAEHMTQTGQIGEFKGRFYFNPERISLPREASTAGLPPVPPAGIFDARLEGDLLVSESSSAELLLRPAGQVAWIRVSPPFRDQDAGATPSMPDLYRVKEYQGTIQRGSSQLLAGQLYEIQAGIDRIVVEYLGQNLPESFQLEQNYPNPFNPTTQIRYALPEASDVRLEVYNLTGQRVAILAQGAKQSGWHQVEFDGSGLASGVYVYRLSTSQGFTQSKRLMLVK